MQDFLFKKIYYQCSRQMKRRCKSVCTQVLMRKKIPCSREVQIGVSVVLTRDIFSRQHFLLVFTFFVTKSLLLHVTTHICALPTERPFVLNAQNIHCGILSDHMWISPNKVTIISLLWKTTSDFVWKQS